MPNIHRMEWDWKLVAESCGYTSIAELLRELYVVRGLSAAHVGDVLDIKRDRVIQLLRKHQIPVRGRGGPRG